MKLYKRGTTWQVDLRSYGLGRMSTGETDRILALKVAKRLADGGDKCKTLNDAMARAWYTHYQNMKSSRNIRSQIARLHASYGALRLEQLTTPWFIRFADDMAADGSDNKTINRYLAVLSKVLNMACDWGWIDAKPRIPRRKESEGRMRTITDAELGTVVKASSGLWIGPLVIFLLHTGCRLGEAINITDEDQQGALETGMWTIPDSKSGKPRTIPLTSLALKALTAWTWKGMSNRQAQREWDRIRQLMGLCDDAGFVLHCLRHTCATRFVNQGHPLVSIQMWMGHSSIKVTEKYAHLNPAALKGMI